MRKKSDPLHRSKEIIAIRKQIAKDLKVYNIFIGELSAEAEKKLARRDQYPDYLRAENERQLHAIKAAVTPFIFNKNVIVQGTVPDGNGGTRIIDHSHFEIMMKAINAFLNAMNMQNKMWGLYMTSEPSGDAAASMNIKNANIAVLQDMQRIAKKEQLALGSRTTHNGPPNTDSR